MEAGIYRELALELERADAEARPIPQISARYPDMTIEDAYGIQSAWMELKYEQGRTKVGRKIGLTSRAMQRASGISEPDFGVILDDMIYWSGQTIPTSKFIVPRIEVEIAFILERPLRGPGCTLLDVLDATKYILPALELIDARVEIEDRDTGKRRNVRDTISDNAANGAVILGGAPCRVSDADLPRIAASLRRNAVIEDSGVAAAVLDHPATGVAWLANKLAPFDAELSPGEIILSGSFTAPVAARPGDVFYADYGQLGVVAIDFSRDDQ